VTAVDRKFWELDPSGDERLAAPDLEIETPDWKGVGRGRYGKVNVGVPTNVAQLLTPTAPCPATLNAQCEAAGPKFAR